MEITTTPEEKSSLPTVATTMKGRATQATSELLYAINHLYSAVDSYSVDTVFSLLTNIRSVTAHIYTIKAHADDLEILTTKKED